MGVGQLLHSERRNEPRFLGAARQTGAALLSPISVARWLLVLVVLAGIYFFHGFVVPVLAALVIAFASWPLYSRLLTRVNGNRTLAASIAIGNEDEKDKARQVMESKVPFKLKNDDWMPYYPDKALELIAWTSIDPSGPEALKTLDRMLNERNPYGHWHTTWVALDPADSSRVIGSVALEIHGSAALLRSLATMPRATPTMRS